VSLYRYASVVVRLGVHRLWTDETINEVMMKTAFA
jgi:hypothetical protein